MTFIFRTHLMCAHFVLALCEVGTGGTTMRLLASFKIYPNGYLHTTFFGLSCKLIKVRYEYLKVAFKGITWQKYKMFPEECIWTRWGNFVDLCKCVSWSIFNMGWRHYLFISLAFSVVLPGFPSIGNLTTSKKRPRTGKSVNPSVPLLPGWLYFLDREIALFLKYLVIK